MSAAPEENDLEMFVLSAMPPADEVHDPMRFQTRDVRDAYEATPGMSGAAAPKRYNRPTQGEVTGS